MDNPTSTNARIFTVIDKLAIARKVIFCAGGLVVVLLIVYPHWRVRIENAGFRADHNIGRSFIASTPNNTPSQYFNVAGIKLINGMDSPHMAFQTGSGPTITYQIHYARLVTETLIAIFFTSAFIWAFKAPKDTAGKQ